jgi:endogenous inhibitor of DNA gyrase (YacG/DUF329 family)
MNKITVDCQAPKCNKPVDQLPGKGRERLYCSDACRKNAYRATHHEIPDYVPVAAASCEQCGNRFRTDGRRKFCSSPCRQKHYRQQLKG